MKASVDQDAASMKMISTGHVFFQPPEFAGITTMPLEEPLKVQQGEYIALYLATLAATASAFSSGATPNSNATAIGYNIRGMPRMILAANGGLCRK